MKQYDVIPVFRQCLDLFISNKFFSHSIQSIKDIQIHSFKYNLSYKELWEENDAMDGRLNMRGITFIKDKIVALPFPKFFNLEEVKYTENLDVSKFKLAFEKIDGSLISPFMIDGEIEIKTMKSIESDLAIEARKNLKDFPNVIQHANDLISKNKSPMYEYVSPTRQIVIKYEKPEFYYLGCRDMESGEIIFPNEEDRKVVKCPMQFISFEEVNEYLEKSNVEGVVLTLDDGQMVKIKTQEYFKLHRVISNFSLKNIVEYIIEGKFDDLIGQLKQNNLKDLIEKAHKINDGFWKVFKSIDEDVIKHYEELKHLSRKEIAISIQFSSAIHPNIGSCIFSKLDGRIYNHIIFKSIKNNLTNIREFNEFIG